MIAEVGDVRRFSHKGALFMDKKRAEEKHFYVYTVAGAAKFLRIYYARVKEYLNTQEIG